LIKQLPGCTSALGTGDLFSGIKKLFSKNSKTSTVTNSTETLENTAEDAAFMATAIPMYSTPFNSRLDQVYSVVKATDEKTADIKTATESDNKNNTCLNSIGKAVIKMIIDKMTVSIVNWIQTGNSGDSFFVKNPSKYFKDIAKEQLLTFGQEISDTSKYPFGKNFMISAANNFNQTFQQNAQYSLDKIMMQGGVSGNISIPSPYTPEDFFGDFSKGGWVAWNGLTQYPQNNPLGFQIMAANELQGRLAGTNKSPAELATEALQQSNGFLNDERCADPVGVTREEDTKARNGEHISYQSGGSYQSTYTQTLDYRKCNQWETVTPGKTISETLTKNMDNSQNALLSADTLNDAIAAILDAALAKLSSTLTNEGLSAISENDISTSYDAGNYDDNGLSDYQSSQADRDFSDYQRDSSPWLQGHPDFNIRTDITQALIDEQRIYIQKLKEQNETLPELIKSIYQLDYCIPGPHPGWEEDAEINLNKLTGRLSEATSKMQDMTDSVWYQLLDTLSLGGLGMVVDIVNTYSFNCGSTKGSNVAKAIGTAFNSMTRIDFWSGENNSAFCSVGGFSAATQEILTQYTELIKKHYNIATLPSVAKEAEIKFNKIPGYEQMIIDNQNAIAFQEGIIKRLQTVKAGVEALNPNSPTYEDDLVIWKNSFARISSGLVSGGDIAHVADLTNQAEAERAYVFDELLQGPGGCEVELKSRQTPLRYAVDWTFERPDYPEELQSKLLYKYSTKNNYSYAKQLDGVSGASYILLPNGDTTWTTKAFLGNTMFWDSLGAGTFIGSSANQWWTDVIDLHKTPENAILNFDSPNFGGNALFFEKALGIY
jgi:hypothetical protein